MIGRFIYGQVDRLPGWFIVGTVFVHFCFLPIMPVQSFAIGERDRKGVVIPICLMSVLLTWARGILLLVAIAMLWGIWEQDAVPRLQLARSGAIAVAYLLSWFFVPRASFSRAIQLGMALHIPPQQIADEFGQDLPDSETLARLQAELKLATPEVKTGLGLAGKLIGGMLLLTPGVWLLYFGAANLLRFGHQGQGSSFWLAFIMFLGMFFSIGGLTFVIEWPTKTSNKLNLVALFVSVLAFAMGPIISRWWVAG